MNKKIYLTIIALTLLTGMIIIPENTFGEKTELLGAGATFPYPLYSKMFDIYNKEYGIKVNYQSIGSGGGQRQLLNKTIDFGASDAYMTDEQLQDAASKILHIPTALGAVILTYNLPGNPVLKFTPVTIADIFLGKITKWNAPEIKDNNPGVKLPDSNIIVVHRSDGSRTTFIFVDYLSKISKEWEEKVSKGTVVNWPAGIGGKGNEGVAGLVKQIPGSIGYTELIYALQNKMPAGIVKNKSGNFITPTIESTSSAANINIPDDTRVSITNTDSPDGYPVSGFTWILVYKEQNYEGRKEGKAGGLVNLLWWMTHQGQKYSAPLKYAPLSGEAVKKAEEVIRSITYNGKQIMGERSGP